MYRSYHKVILSALMGLVVLLSACGDDTPEPQPQLKPEDTQYPLNIATIFINKCATAGCHNEASSKAAGGLRLDDWSYLFNGSNNGAAVVPYSTGNSSLLYFINPGAYDNISVSPTMPYNSDPLTKEEYDGVKSWIADGAPDKNGNIPFGDNAENRQKAYLTQQGCDLMAVIDADKNVVMRYIQIGKSNIAEAPHFVKVDDAGRYAYVCFTAGSYVQKIDTRTDEVVGEADLSNFNGGLSWNVLNVSPDGSKVLVSQLKGGNGNLVLIDANTMKASSVRAQLDNPHGIAANPAFDTFYVTGQYGNTVYKVMPDRTVEKISIDGNPSITKPGPTTPDPHEIMMTPDYSKYFLTCEKSHEVRVMDRLQDKLIKAIPVGKVPKELAVSKTKPYMFVTCQEDNSQTGALYKGSVYVINYNTLEIVKRIDGTFFQPHGITVDDRNGTFYVASRNAEQGGPAPHHVSDCAGRNGYYQVYDMETLEPVKSTRFEVTPDPYSFDMRF